MTPRRRLSTVHRLNGDLVLHTKGALQSLLPLCRTVAEDGGLSPLDAAARERVLASESELAAQGLRVLAVAWRRVAEGERPDHGDVEHGRGGGREIRPERPRAEGAITETHIVGELGDVLLGRIEGRTGPAEVTIFKSLGLAIEDLAAAELVLRKAEAGNTGQVVELGGRRDFP